MFRRFLPLLRSLVLRPMLRDRLRTLITVAGIAVGVSVLVAIQLSNDSALRAFGESVDAVAGKANYQIASEAVPIDEKVLLSLQRHWDAGVRFAPVIDVEGLMAPSEIPIRILGVDLFSDLHFRDYRYARIAAGERSATTPSLESYLGLFEGNAIVVPEPFAKQHGLELGSAITVSSSGRDAKFVVRGILKAEGPATAFNGSLGVVDISVAQSAFGLEGTLTRVDLMIPEAQAGDITAAIASTLPPPLRIERPSRRNERVGAMLQAFRTNLLALAGVALLVGMFLVYNTVLISVLRRRREVGILKTLGASPRGILAAFLAEGAIFGAIGSIAGVGLGYAIAFSTLDLVGRTVQTLYVATAPSKIQLTPGLAILAITLGIFVSLLAALQPSIEAARITPSSLIRPGVYQRLSRRSSYLFALAAITMFLGAWLASEIPPLGRFSAGGYLSVFFVVAGVSFLAPLALIATSRIAREPLGRLSIAGRIAAASIPASLRRTAVAAAALTTAIAMMIAISVMVGSFRTTVSAWVEQTVRSDIWIRPASGLGNAPFAVFPARISEDIDAIPFVEAYDRFRGKDLVYREQLIAIGAGDFDVAARYSSLPMITPRTSKEAFAAARGRDGVFISESLSLRHDLTAGEAIELPTARGITRFPIVGVYRDYSNDRGVVVMDRSTFLRHFRDDTINTIAIFLREGTDPELARREIERILGRRYKAFAFTNGAIRTEVLRIFDQTFLITWALLGVAIIVAVLGIVNTIAALVIERRSEIALIRTLGMTRGQTRLTIVIESALIGFVAAVLGIVTGLVLSSILIFVINRQSFGWTIEFDPPWNIVVISTLVTFVATALAGLIPARLATGTNLANSLKN
jgi:putative ABC transport system permease protein